MFSSDFVGTVYLFEFNLGLVDIINISEALLDSTLFLDFKLFYKLLFSSFKTLFYSDFIPETFFDIYDLVGDFLPACRDETTNSELLTSIVAKLLYCSCSSKVTTESKN